MSSEARSDIPYQIEAPNAYGWTERAYDLLQEGKLGVTIATTSGVRTAIVGGACPNCQDEVNFRQVLDTVTGDSLSTLGRYHRGTEHDRYLTLTVSCRCTERHEGRPDAVAHGCGINFVVDVLMEP